MVDLARVGASRSSKVRKLERERISGDRSLERLGSIDTLRTSGAGDSQSGDDEGRERSRCTGRFRTAKPEAAEHAGGDTDTWRG